MPKWSPSPIWQGEDAYVIGGGDSLRHFDWDSIRGKNTVGCNSAFVLGADICKVLVFGDYLWWKNIGSKQLQTYGGIVVGCSPQLPGSERDLPEWLLLMDREERKLGLSTTALGFNGNTGSLAINLALILGAQRVFLLGFDMKMGEGNKPNWHDVRYELGSPSVYPIFMRQFQMVAKDLPLVFPGREVINVSDVSQLSCFPKVSLMDHFGRQPIKGGIK